MFKLCDWRKKWSGFEIECFELIWVMISKLGCIGYRCFFEENCLSKNKVKRGEIEDL